MLQNAILDAKIYENFDEILTKVGGASPGHGALDRGRRAAARDRGGRRPHDGLQRAGGRGREEAAERIRAGAPLFGGVLFL